MRAALALCDTVRGGHFRTDDVHFAAATDAGGTLLSLVVSTAKPGNTAALARDWAETFVRSRRAGAARQWREQKERLTQRVRRLHDELLSVDTELAKAAPEIYGDVVEVDFPKPRLPGSRLPTVPRVPEEGSVELLNLAYERLALIDALREAAEAFPRGIAPPNAKAYATVESVSAPAHFPASTGESAWPLVLVTILLLVACVMLVAAIGLLSRRRARRQSP